MYVVEPHGILLVACFLKHLSRDVNADKRAGLRIHMKRNSGADPDFQYLITFLNIRPAQSHLYSW